MNYLSKNILPWPIYNLLAISFLILFLANCKQEKVVEKVPVPEVTNISPLEGTVGDIVLVEGKNFGWEPIVTATINDSVAVVKRVSDTEIELIVPENVEGEGDIVLIIGETKIVWGEKFKYIIVVLTGPQVSTYAGNGTKGDTNGSLLEAQFTDPLAVAIDTNGNLFVVEQGSHRIRKITPEGIVSTFAGGNGPGFQDGPGSEAKFRYLIGIDIGPDGNMYVADVRNNRIRKITPDGVVSTLAGTGEIGTADGPANTATFAGPIDVATDSEGNVYVIGYDSHKVRKISVDGMVSTIAGSTKGFADGTGTNAKFNNPRGIISDPEGTLYVADGKNHRIRKITPDGVVTTFAGSTEGFSDGTGSAAKFKNPRGLCWDNAGNIIVSDGRNYKVRMITPEAVVTTIAGSTIGYLDGPGNEAKFNVLTGVIVTPDGIIYVPDEENHVIRKIEFID